MILERLGLQAATATLTIVLGVMTSQLTTALPQPRVAVLVPMTLLAVLVATVVAEGLARLPTGTRHDGTPSTVSRPGHGLLSLRLRLPMVALVLGLLVGIGSGAAVVLTRRLTQPPPGPALAVDSVRLAVEPRTAEGRCPTASFTFLGEIRTNGGSGNLAFAWVEPDGQTAPARSVAVEAGTTVVRQSLRFTFAGRSAATGVARLQVTRPVEMSSAPVTARFACP